MTFFMIALTNSLHKLVNATIKYTGEPTRSHGEFAFNLGVDNWDQMYGTQLGFEYPVWVIRDSMQI